MTRSSTLIGAALLTAVSINAHALSFDDAVGAVHTGSGSGDLVLALVSGSESLLWDLSATLNAVNDDLQVRDIRQLAAAGQSFSITNSEVSAFLTPERAANAKWQVFGISNVGTTGGDIFAPDTATDFGFAMTVDGPLQEALGGDLNFQVESNALWLQANKLAGITENGVLTATDGQDHFFTSPTGDHDFVIAKQDATADSLDVALAFYYLRKDPSRPVDAPLLEDPQLPGSNLLPVLTEELGTFRLAANGTLTFTSAVTPIPVPAAAWLMGSGLLALAGAARRRR